MIPFEAMLQMLKDNHVPDVAILIEPCHSPKYHTGGQFIKIGAYAATNKSLQDYLQALHEVGHAIQHHRWPILFALRNWWVVGHFVKLFLEYDASQRAINYMKSTGASPNALHILKKEMWRGLKTYL